MVLTVAKFGGSSTATGDSIMRVAAISEADPARKVCVVSAPGKRPGCLKMTDLLRYGEAGVSFERAVLLINELGLSLRNANVIAAKFHELCARGNDASRMSFGEWLSAYLLSCITGRRLIDATEVLFFSGNHVQTHIWWDKNERVVIPGFYGLDVHTENITLFPRGGSDISASLIAQAMSADVCENWTDVSGVYSADPNKFQHAARYEMLDYQELLSVAKSGAQVFHPEAIAPLEAANIPLKIMNTFAPHEGGTLVSKRSP